MYKDVGKQQQNQPESERYFLVKETTRKTRGHTPHKGGMEGAASGARAAAAGLSVPAAMPIDKGQLSPLAGLRELSLFVLFTPLPLSYFRSICWPPPVHNKKTVVISATLASLMSCTLKKLSNNFKSSITRCSCDKYGVVHFPARQSENEPRPISSAHFTLDSNGYPVVSPNDQGAPCCVVYPSFNLHLKPKISTKLIKLVTKSRFILHNAKR